MSGVGTGPGLDLRASSAWTPKRLGSALELWLRADKGITLNGSAVSAWADQSTKGRNFSQATGANQPAYSATGLSGRPVVSATAASSHYMECDTTATPITGTKLAVFLALKRGAYSISRVPMSFSNNVGADQSTTDTFTMENNPDGTAYLYRAGFGGTLATHPTNGSAFLFGAEWDGATGIVHINAGTNSSGTHTAAFNVKTLRLFCRSQPGPALYSNYALAEAIIVSGTLSTANKARIKNYLRAHYSLY